MQEKETLFDRILKGSMFLAIFGVLDAILLGVFGYAGNFVKNFLLGAFGQLVYAYCIAATFASVFILLGFKPKISLKATFNYILIIFVMICIGHLATYTEYAHLSYSDYLSHIYNARDSLAGVAVGAIMFPFAKLYAFSMVVFSLTLVGLIALAIVGQINFEIGFKLRSRSKKKPSSSKQLFSSTDDYYPQEEQFEQPQRELYNGDVNGKLFDNKKAKSSKKYDDFTIVPIDEDYQYQEDDDSIISGIALDTNDVQSEIKLTQQRVDMFNNAVPITEVVNNVEPIQEVPNETKSNEQYELSDEDKLYLNSYRRERSLGENAVKYGGDIKSNKDLDPFDVIMSSITKSLGEDETDKPQETNMVIPPQVEEKVDVQTIEPIKEEPIIEPIKEETEKIDIVLPFEEEKEVKQEIKPEIIPEIKPEKIEENKPVINETPTMNLNIVDTNTVGSDLYNKNKELPQEPVRPINQVKDYSSPLVKYVTGRDEETKPEPKPIKQKRIYKKYNPPSYNILRDYPKKEVSADIEEKIEDLKSTLTAFKLNINVRDTITGPTFSRIEFQLEPGTPVSKLTSRKDDIKMGLAAESLRLLAPIPGKNYCGVELPNKTRNIVGLKETMISPDYQNAIKSDKGLIFAFGKDIAGESYFFDLTKTPHLLIAGGTGSGKSVALNVLITSLIYRYSPDDLRFILFDPKQVEFSIYKDIPHLLIPHILTDPKKALTSLQWASNEMERRYTLLTNNNVRNIAEYNNLDYIKKDPTLKLPYIVIIVDEFGDVMLSEVGKPFEILIQKLAAKARAAGIHLVLATQRPTTDVISGTIKTNLPCRMAFRVSSNIDSMTILNSTGAEELLGWGDMLFLNSSDPALKRVQGAYIDTEEVIDVIDYIKNHNDKYFDEEIEALIMKEEEKQEEHMEPKQTSMFPDELCLQALETCIMGGQVSVSYLQRKLAVGYSRGAKLVDWMTDMGYVKVEGNKKVMTISMNDLEEIKLKGNGDGTIL